MVSGHRPQGPGDRPPPGGARQREPLAVAELLAWVDSTVQALLAAAPGGDIQRLDPQAFALGEALGRLFRERCRQCAGPHGLALLLDGLLAGRAASQDAEAALRARLFAGLCWDLEGALALAPAAPPLGPAAPA